MVYAISGFGPRVGSSFVMRQIKESGIPIVGSAFHRLQPIQGNPLGYYDLDDNEVRCFNEGVGKVWPRQLVLLPTMPTKMVTLERRDRESWLASIQRQINLEKLPISPEQVLEMTEFMLDVWLDTFPGDVMRVYTEDLDHEINNILKFIGE